MQFPISERTAELLRQLMAPGHFATEDEAIADAVRFRLEDEAVLGELAVSLEESRESIRAGRGTLLTPELGPRILSEAGERRDSRAATAN